MTRSPVIMIYRLGTLLFWIFAIYLIVVHDSWYLLLTIVLFHTVELIWTGYQRGIKAGYSGMHSIFMTLVWGFTWWLYLDE